jgi:hypothetical protein
MKGVGLLPNSLRATLTDMLDIQCFELEEQWVATFAAECEEMITVVQRMWSERIGDI